MKINKLGENEPLEVIEVSKHTVYKPFSLVFDEDRNDNNVYEYKRIKMKVFTDGELINESDESVTNIDEYFIGDEKYKHDVDTLKKKNLYFKNHSYVITYLITRELMNIGNIHGWFDVIEDVSIYLQNPKDKTALRNAKLAIKEIENNNQRKYISIFDVLFTSNKNTNTLETEKVSEGVYTLKKTKKR